MQKFSQNTSWQQAGVPDHWIGIYKSMQNLVGWRKEEKKRRVSETGPAPGGWGNWSGGKMPISGKLFGTEGQHLTLSEHEAAGLWHSEWSENHTDNPCRSPTHPGQGLKSPGTFSGWELEHRDWSAGWRPLLTHPRGHKGGDRGRECLWRKARKPRRPGHAAESHAEGGATLKPLSPHTPALAADQQRKNTERLAIEWLMCQAGEQDASQGDPLSACCHRLEKDSNSAMAPAPVVASIPEHLKLPGSPKSKQLCHLQAWSSLGQTQVLWESLRRNSCR